MIGRVVRRYPFSGHLAFLDLAGSSSSSYSVIVEGALVDVVNICRVGDLVALNGSVAINSKEEWQDQRVSINATSIEIIDVWDSAAMGSLIVDWEVFRHVNYTNVPNFFVQCDHATMERLLQYIPATSTRQSCSTLSSTRDRIIAVWSDHLDLESSILTDKFSGPAIRRVYPMRTSDTIAYSSHPSLSESVSNCLSTLEKSRKIRVQAFPRNQTGAVLKIVEAANVLCDPRDFDIVLNVVLSDAVYHVSAVSRKFISSQLEAPHAICRAEAKIAEALTRRCWKLQSTRLALDIGAAPGGWSNYLATMVDRVIAVDKGEVLCQTEKVTHWKMSGEEAISKLIDLKELVDFFCCDANIAPEMTFSLFERVSPIFRGRFVLTFKNTYKLKKEWEDGVECILRKMTSFGCTEVLTHHLLSNTQLETTVSGIFNPN